MHNDMRMNEMRRNNAAMKTKAGIKINFKLLRKTDAISIKDN